MKLLPFTQEQIATLKRNIYTADVNEKHIHYTLDFKIFVIEQVRKGITSTKIFKMAGYDPDMLGKRRIYEAVRAIKKQADSAKGLQQAKSIKMAERFAQEDVSKKQTTKAMKDMQKQIIEMQQEIDFLKKTFQILENCKTDM